MYQIPEFRLSIIEFHHLAQIPKLKARYHRVLFILSHSKSQGDLDLVDHQIVVNLTLRFKLMSRCLIVDPDFEICMNIHVSPYTSHAQTA